MNDQNMRVLMSKKMLQEGLFRCLQKKTIDKITVSELCREAGVNRTTFYNHYTEPRDILLEFGMRHAEKVKTLFLKDETKPKEDRKLDVLKYIYSEKDKLKVLFLTEVDAHFGYSATSMFTWIVDDVLKEHMDLELRDETEREMVYDSLGWSIYFITRQWLLQHEEKTPEEMHDFFLRLGKKR